MPHLHIRPRGMRGFMFYSATMILAGLVKTETRRGALLPCGLCATSFSATHLRVRHANTMRRTQAADACVLLQRGWVPSCFTPSVLFALHSSTQAKYV